MVFLLLLLLLFKDFFLHFLINLHLIFIDLFLFSNNFSLLFKF